MEQALADILRFKLSLLNLKVFAVRYEYGGAVS